MTCSKWLPPLILLALSLTAPAQAQTVVWTETWYEPVPVLPLVVEYQLAPPVVIQPPVLIQAAAPCPCSGGLCVYAIAKSDRAPFSHFIAAGRTRNNDVVVLDVSVSKFHALFKKDANDVYSVQDAGSRNGTAIAGKPVPDLVSLLKVVDETPAELCQVQLAPQPVSETTTIASGAE